MGALVALVTIATRFQQNMYIVPEIVIYLVIHLYNQSKIDVRVILMFVARSGMFLNAVARQHIDYWQSK